MSVYLCSGFSYSIANCTFCMLHCTITCGLCGCTIFSHTDLKNGTIFGEKVIEHNMCVLVFLTIFV